ncbi:hypothetical protein [Pseudomonas frederiksbergensis]|uniref:hypothetical protein n=1 Tax=Pseudomonas frederiksbergensis TaxID=104087 RepID=UPI003D207AA2
MKKTRFGGFFSPGDLEKSSGVTRIARAHWMTMRVIQCAFMPLSETVCASRGQLGIYCKVLVGAKSAANSHNTGAQVNTRFEKSRVEFSKLSISMKKKMGG